MRAGIDTLMLTTTDYQIYSDSVVEEVPPIYSRRTGEVTQSFPLYEINGEISYLKGAYSNKKNFNFDIKYKSSLKHGLFMIHFSVPKVHNRGNNFYPVNKEGTESVLNQIQKELTEDRIGVNIFDCNISRVDIFKNVTTDESIIKYVPIFEKLKCQRRKEKKNIGTTYYWSNGVGQICVYDKIQDMVDKKMVGFDSGDYPKNVLRFEERLLKGAKVKSILGIRNLGEVMKQYDSLEEYYCEIMSKDLFKYQPSDINKIVVTDFKKDFLFHYNISKRNWLSYYLRDEGYKSIILKNQKEAFTEAIADFCLDIGLNPKTKDRRLRRTKTDIYQTELNLMQKQKSGVDKYLSDLYSELKSKVLLRAA